MQEVLVNRLGGLSLPKKSAVRLTDRPDMTLDVYHGCKTTVQQQQQLEACTVSRFCPFTVISLRMPLALFVISLVFSALISILYLVQVLSRFQLGLLIPAPPQLEDLCHLANSRLVIFLPHMLTLLPCSSRASDMIRLRKMLMKVGDKRHPCLTLTVVLNHSHMLPFI